MRIILIMMASLFCLNANGLVAQSAPSEQPSSQTESKGESKKTLIRSLVDEKGNKIPVNIDLDSILKAQQSQNDERAPQAEEIPDFTITRLEITGQVQEEWAEIQAKFTVRINAESGIFSVPLGLNQGTLTDYSHEGPGDVAPDQKKVNTGQVWWFSGKGEHTLTLEMLVPIRQKSAFPHLYLSLPKEVATRKATLLLPSHNLKFNLPQTVRIKRRELELGETEIQFHIPGSALDLTWQYIPLEDQSKMVKLNADTRIDLLFLQETIKMKVRQTVSPIIQHGRFDRIEIQLPRGFQLNEVKGSAYQEHNESEKNNTVEVLLKEAASGPVTLEYSLDSDIPESGSLILDEAFRLLNKSSLSFEQHGIITVQHSESYRIRYVPGVNDQIKRTSISIVNSEAPLSQAFEFYKQPYRLDLNVEKIKPIVSVEPFFNLKVMPDVINNDKQRLSLVATIPINVLRGEIQRLHLPWPAFEAEGWKLGDLEQLYLVENVSFNSEEKQVEFDFLTSMNGQFELILRADKLIPVKEKITEISLPEFLPEVQKRQLPATISVITASNLKPQLTPVQPTTFRPLTAEERKQRSESTVKKEHQFLVQKISTTPKQRFILELEPQKQEVKAKTLIELEPNSNRITARQQITLDAAYEPLSEIILNIPANLSAGGFVVRDSQNQLIPVPDANSNETSTAILKLPAFLGTYKFVVEYIIESTGTAEDRQQYHLPFFTLESKAFESVEMLFNEENQFELDMDSKGWQSVVKERETSWLLDQKTANTAAVTFSLQKVKQLVIQDYRIQLAYYEINLSTLKNLRVNARYRIIGDPKQINLRMPDASHKQLATWNGRSLETAASDSNQWTIDVRNQPLQDIKELTISYHLPVRTEASWIRKYRVPLPQFDSEIWIEESIAELAFPNAQHLLTSPPTWSPLFNWKREGMFWYRRPLTTLTDNNLYQQLRSDNSVNSRYQYNFRKPDAGIAITFSTIALPMVVLCGAGFALVCGFFFRSLSYLQNSLVFLLFLTIIAISGLWFWSTMQLFIQPALIGIVLAGLAVGIEVFFRRPPQYVELNSSADFVLTSPLNSGMGTQHIGSEDSTAIRLPSAPPNPVSKTESGATL